MITWLKGLTTQLSYFAILILLHFFPQVVEGVVLSYKLAK